VQVPIAGGRCHDGCRQAKAMRHTATHALLTADDGSDFSPVANKIASSRSHCNYTTVFMALLYIRLASLRRKRHDAPAVYRQAAAAAGLQATGCSDKRHRKNGASDSDTTGLDISMFIVRS
jgi:hypothetical protein